MLFLDYTETNWTSPGAIIMYWIFAWMFGPKYSADGCKHLTVCDNAACTHICILCISLSPRIKPFLHCFYQKIKAAHQTWEEQIKGGKNMLMYRWFHSFTRWQTLLQTSGSGSCRVCYQVLQLIGCKLEPSCFLATPHLLYARVCFKIKSLLLRYDINHFTWVSKLKHLHVNCLQS